MIHNWYARVTPLLYWASNSGLTSGKEIVLVVSKILLIDILFKDNIFDAYSFLTDLILNHRITKDEYYDHILLPLKFGTVSMASKTNALIVPYAITGTYKFRSKDLTIRFGEPFIAENDLEKANLELQERIKNLVKESLKNSGK